MATRKRSEASQGGSQRSALVPEPATQTEMDGVSAELEQLRGGLGLSGVDAAVEPPSKQMRKAAPKRGAAKAAAAAQAATPTEGELDAAAKEAAKAKAAARVAKKEESRSKSQS